MRLRVNEQNYDVDANPETPLLYILADDLQLKGPRFGCGLAQCGSCSVLLNGREIRSCVTPISAVQNGSITTLEGLPQLYAAQSKLPTVPDLHPVQQAFIHEQAPQCGYCYNGITIKAAELLSQNPDPSEQHIRQALDGHLCRCGTYPQIMKAIRRAAEERKSGVIVVKHIYAALDCGIAVNPSIVENQIVGMSIQATSRMLKEAVTFSQTNVTSLDWEAYPVLRFGGHPEVTPIIVARNEPSLGAGEEALAAVGAAIANAFYDATGVQLTEYPMTPRRVLAALQA
jgi:aerobic-type carbon monoxide dehydrogenase small subunit (CoxS/CutS family)